MTWNDQYIREAERTVGQRIQAAGFYLLTRVRENISVAGTRQADSSYVGKGYEYERTDPESMTTRYANAFGVANKRYRKGRRIYGAVRSKPGEFPLKQTGLLRQSISQDYDASRLTARVGTTLSYGRFLELGTSKMSKRPYLRTTLYMEELKIRELCLFR